MDEMTKAASPAPLSRGSRVIPVVQPSKAQIRALRADLVLGVSSALTQRAAAMMIGAGSTISGLTLIAEIEGLDAVLTINNLA